MTDPSNPHRPDGDGLSEREFACLLANAIFAENLDEMPTQREEHSPSFCQADMLEAAREIQQAGFVVVKRQAWSALPTRDGAEGAGEIEVWIEREFAGYGVAVRRKEEPPIPGEPLMSMVEAKELTRRAVAEFSRSTSPAVVAEPDDQDPPMRWLIGALRDLARDLLADPKTPWIGERDPKQHICWTAADRLSLPVQSAIDENKLYAVLRKYHAQDVDFDSMWQEVCEVVWPDQAARAQPEKR